MSDFLSNLAAKNLNLASVIQPRPSARFEPVPTRRAMTTEAPIDPSALESVNTVESDAPRSPAVAPRQAPVVPSAPIEPPARSAASILRHSPSMSQQIESPAIAPRTPEVRREVQREIVNVTNVRSVMEQSIIQTPTREQIIIEKESADRDRAASPIGLETTVKPLPVENRTAISPRPIVTPVIERVVHEHTDQTQVPSSRTDLPPRATAPQMRGVEKQSSAEPPAIHVTIGRVEVRATSSAAPTKRPSRSSSALSLDDYLRARNGGQR